MSLPREQTDGFIMFTAMPFSEKFRHPQGESTAIYILGAGKKEEPGIPSQRPPFEPGLKPSQRPPYQPGQKKNPKK
jgi:hypothetical protein